MLARRSYSAAGLAERLRTRFDEETAAGAVARMIELRLVDDRAFAESFVEDRFERRGHGRHRILRDLVAAGVSSTLATEIVDSRIGRGAERARAEEVLRRFLARRAAVATADQDQRGAAFRHLVGRGFPADLVRDLIGVSL